LYAIAGVGALVGAALVYSYISADDNEVEEQEADLQELISEKGLDDVKRTAQNTLEKKYFLSLL